MNNIINKNLVKLDLESTNRDGVIKELAKLIDSEDRLISYDEYISEVFEREVKTSTGIGFGIAIPHGKCEAVKIPTVAFGRKRKGIEWDSLDGNPVEIVFLLAVPCEGDRCDEHLRILSALSRKLLHEEFTDKLRDLGDERELVELLESVIA